MVANFAWPRPNSPALDRLAPVTGGAPLHATLRCVSLNETLTCPCIRYGEGSTLFKLEYVFCLVGVVLGILYVGVPVRESATISRFGESYKSKSASLPAHCSIRYYS